MPQIGDTEVFSVAYYDSDNALIVPSPVPKITIISPTGTTLVNAANMTQLGSSAVFTYEYTYAANGNHYWYTTTTDTDASPASTPMLSVTVAAETVSASVWAYTSRTLTSAVNLGAIDVTLLEADSYVARLDFTMYKRIDYVTGSRAGTVRFRYNVNLSGATVKLVGAYKGRGEGEDINITGSAAVDPDDSSYYIVEFSVPTSTSDRWGHGDRQNSDRAYLYEVRAYKDSIDDVLQRGWISIPESPPVAANS